jgi:hypothetical protein
LTLRLTAAVSAGIGLVLARPALAADFGFVRWPDYLDTYILIAAIATGLGFVWLKLVLPKGTSFDKVPKADRTAGMKLAASMTGIAFVALMGMVFVGMGLQRAAE